MPEEPLSPRPAIIHKLGGVTRLSAADRRAIESLPFSIRSIPARQDIVHEGGPSRHCCVLLDGWAECYQSLDGGRHQIVSLHVPGDLPDLMSLHLSEPDFGMGSLTPVVVAFIPHASLRDLINSSPALATALWRETMIAAAIHRVWMTGIGRRNARERLAHLFCELYLRLEAVGLVQEHRFLLPLRQSDLADALGLTSVHINRMLRDLRSEGLISLENRKVGILDWTALCAVAEFDPSYLHLSDEQSPSS